VSEPVPVRIDCRDPSWGMGVVTQLRSRPEVTITGASRRPAVLIAVVDRTDDPTLRWLRSRHAGTGLPIVLVVAQVDPGPLVGLVELGVCAVLSRVEATAERLVRAIRLAAAGRGDLPPALVRHLLDHAGSRVEHPGQRGTRRSARPPCGGMSRGGSLSPREREVLRLMADGMSTREVAARLAYSERTIKFVVQDLMLRLNVRNRTQAVAMAVRNGWI
jgi:DNA-binding NarL/FixJ family response regulator